MDRTMIEVNNTSASSNIAPGSGMNINTTNTNSSTANTNVSKAKSTSPVSYFSSPSIEEEDSIDNTSHDEDQSSPTFRKSSTTTQQHQQQNNTQDVSPALLRPLGDFLFEDPTIYTSEEIKEVLDMINDGNLNEVNTWKERYNDPSTEQKKEQREQQQCGGLKPICKAYGILGFIRFLDCYYLTLITKRAKVGCIGGNSIYTVKVSSLLMFQLMISIYE
jgi:hypothetical protein